MKIGFDAKRAYCNATGLGNYSRTLISLLAKYFPEEEYYLFTPKASTSLFNLNDKHVHRVLPASALHRLFSSVWRSRWMTNDLVKNKINIFHGLSHEIPMGIHKTGVKSIVTIHDLIHEKYPEQYNPIDIKIYNQKYRYACQHADKIVAISEHTKKDIIDLYKIPEEKILVCVQSCDPVFSKIINEETKQQVAQEYHLPKEFFLSVGSIIERKNLLNVCKALLQVQPEIAAPLVVIGNGRKYKKEVKTFIAEHGLEKSVIFLSEQFGDNSRISQPETLAAIYQLSLGMIYPSFYEGFGLPVMEALSSEVPVITSNVSSLPEAGGDAAFYVNPAQPEEIATGMKKIYGDKMYVQKMKEKGKKYALQNTGEMYAHKMMKIYQSLC